MLRLQCLHRFSNKQVPGIVLLMITISNTILPVIRYLCYRFTYIIISLLSGCEQRMPGGSFQKKLWLGAGRKMGIPRGHLTTKNSSSILQNEDSTSKFHSISIRHRSGFWSRYTAIYQRTWCFDILSEVTERMAAATTADVGWNKMYGVIQSDLFCSSVSLRYLHLNT